MERDSSKNKAMEQGAQRDPANAGTDRRGGEAAAVHTTAGDMAEKGRRTYEQRYGEVMLQLPVEVDAVAATYLGENRAHGVGIWDTGSNRTVISNEP